MTVKLYSVTDDPKTLHKTLGEPIELSCTLVYPTNISTPTIRISSTNFTPDLNYMYLSDFNRYYFIDPDKVIYDNGGAIVITGRVDVLKSYENDISALNVNVIRQENAGITKIVDNKITVTPNKKLDYYMCDKTPFNIRSVANEYNYVIVVAGGEQEA